MNELSGDFAVGGRVCVSIGFDTLAESIAAAKQAEKGADVIEIRLDYMSDPGIAPFMDAIATPLLFTNRPVWEGGEFSGKEEERIKLLLEAVRAGAAFVDIELRSEQSSRERILDEVRNRSNTRVIISWHDFSGTPSVTDLERIFQDQSDSGADVGKIVCTAHTYQDVLKVLNLQLSAAKTDFPLIAFSMGKAGVISRAATLELGGFMTYAASDTGKITAPGQLSVSALRSILNAIAANT